MSKEGTGAKMRWWPGRTGALSRLLVLGAPGVSAILSRQCYLELINFSKEGAFVDSQVLCGSSSIVIGLLESSKDCLALRVLQRGRPFNRRVS